MSSDSSQLMAQLRALDANVRHMLAEDLPLQLAAIRESLSRGDLELARHDVHAVRGSAAFCKLAALRDAATRLEISLTHNDRNAADQRAFENNVERVLHALEHETENG